uniref:Arginine--tRNA ligase n=1 Tax=Acetithermum autotrophicum TaxID=1446466 RepID=H5ST69_ACEAU|nr:arginyl-tRNA synthetase [Candidatus Acetothermum autotrophicum]
MLRELVRERLQETIQKLYGLSVPVEISVPEKPEFGDLSSTIAFALKAQLSRAPRQIAEEIKASLAYGPGEAWFEKIEVVGPGFINFFLKPETIHRALWEILTQGHDYGTLKIGQGKRAQVEFVSANPTGPLTIGHCRQAVLGDVISRLLENAGYDVTREYYYNDAGRQMKLLGESVRARYLELLGKPVSFPEEGYHGEYIYEIARKIQQQHGESWADAAVEQFTEFAERELFTEIKQTLSRLFRLPPERVFDVYYNESWLQTSSGLHTVLPAAAREKVIVTSAQVLQWLHELGLAYEKDGAIWFKATALGRPQDRVLVRSHTGEPTYRLPDMAYHANKLLRGFDLIIDIFGADHQDTYQDVLAAVRALWEGGKLPKECTPDKIRVLIHQWVNLLRGGQPVKMSKRMATFVTIDELIDEIKHASLEVHLRRPQAGEGEQSRRSLEDFAVNVVRFFLLMRSPDSHVNFDLDLAKSQSKDNPVYYVMYAYTRIKSIFEKLGELPEVGKADLAILCEQAELNLIKKLDEFPQVVHEATEHLAPHFLANYAHELAGLFHDFYEKYRVLDETNPERMKARLALCRAVQIVLERAFALLGLKAPERM